MAGAASGHRTAAQRTRFSQIAAVSVLGRIGFTMFIFIAELGFAEQPEYLLMAKIGMLAASLLAGVLGFVWLWWLEPKSSQSLQPLRPNTR